MSIRRLKYLSRFRPGLTEADILQILETSQRNNGAVGICGMLMHSQKAFFQVLEGPPEALAQVWQRIMEDERHTHVQLLEDVESEDGKRFEGFSMQELSTSVPGVANLEAIASLLDAAAYGPPAEDGETAAAPQDVIPVSPVVTGEVAVALDQLLTEVALLVHRAFGVSPYSPAKMRALKDRQGD